MIINHLFKYAQGCDIAGRLFQSRLLNRPLWQAIQLNLDLRISEDNSQNELTRVLLLHPTTIMQQEWTVEGT